ncbi:hypothetical protein F4808DRAFT_458644 [Astrocystis sublimbata]|nr:hypothetical protein F4808DRAFT_458644 [Astrocystis sublimbata]
MRKLISLISELDPYLDTKNNNKHTDQVLELVCQICQRRKLAIPAAVAHAFQLRSMSSDETPKPSDLLFDLYAQGFERALVLPCGHVFGDRCGRDKYEQQRDFICPTCGFRMTYTKCGHAIAPAYIPVSSTTSTSSSSVRDTFPLTIPEGGQPPSHCRECRLATIRSRLRYALNSECVICAQRAQAGLAPGSQSEHEAHRRRHVRFGIKEKLGEVMMLVQPDFTTRETVTAAEEKDERDVNTALLYALALTELEGSVWYRTTTTTTQLAAAKVRRHAAGVRELEDYVFDLLMRSGKDCRRPW